MELRLKNVRIAFPALDVPATFGDGEPAYQAKFIIEPKSENVKLLDEAMIAVAKDQWKDKAPGVLELLKEDKKLCFLHSPYKNKKTGEPYLGFEGKYSLSTRSKNRPTVFDRNNVEVKDGRDIKAMIYSGCFVHAKINVWAQDNQYGRRINASIDGVMFAKEGEAFGGSTPASASDFEDLKADEEESLV